MEIVLLILRLVLAAVFLTAGVGKLLDREGSEKALSDFELPGSLVRPVAFLLPWVEIAVAVGLLFIQSSWLAAIGGMLLLLSFTAGMLYQMSKGNAPDCHCFGQIHSEPVSPKSVIRNVVLGLLALVLVASGQSYQGIDIAQSSGIYSGVGIMEIVVGVAVIGLLTAIVFILRKISDQQNQIMRRIEILEVVSSEGKEVTRESLSDPHAGLPLGSPLPAFSVSDEAGKAISSNEVRTEGKPALLMFVSPTCHPCESLVPDINSWNEELGDKLDIVLISSGDFKENLDKFGAENGARIYLQEEKSVSDLMGALWTPTAILVDSNGAIASRNAVGDTAIRELVEELKNTGVENDYLFFANGSNEGIKIGTEVPEFSLMDLEGNEITAEMLKGKKTLATFWSTTCPFCINMIEDLKAWNSSRGDHEPQLIVFSDGDPENHKALGLDAPILLEKDYATAARIGMNGTPSAVLIDQNARIVSETGVGAEMIWALLGRKGVSQAESEQ